MLTETPRDETGTQDRLIAAWLTEAKRDGIVDDYAGKRRWPRVTWQTQVTLQIDTPRGTRTVFAAARDISEGGIGLRVRERLAAMTPVRVIIGETNEFVIGRVAHCTDSLGGFVIGIEFQRVESVGVALRKSA
jgi:hypothetical protein